MIVYQEATDSEDDSDAEDDAFCRKLFAEMMSEYGETWGDYEQGTVNGTFSKCLK